MKPLPRFLIIGLLSLATGWLGLNLGEQSLLNNSASTTSSGPLPTRYTARSQAGTRATSSAGADYTQLLHQQVARCETRALWSWMLSNSNEEGPEAYAVVEELIARLGTGAWDQVMALEDYERKERAASLLLDATSRTDPWKALEIYQNKRGSFSEQWGIGALANVIDAASAKSADHVISAMEQMGSSGAINHRVGASAKYAKGFDFQKLADYMRSSETAASWVPGDILKNWAEQDPLQVSEWLIAHSDPMDGGGIYRLNTPYAIHDVINELIESTDPSREAALATISQLPPSTIQQVWNTRSGENFDPAALFAADIIQQRDAYLTETLLRTKGSRQLDASWNKIPLAERTKVLNAAVQKWAAEAPLPVDQRARQRWREMVEKSWKN